MQAPSWHADTAAAPPDSIMTRHIIPWRWQRHVIGIATETIGEGRPVLMLPAFSTISTMDEMRPLARRLAADGHACTLIDWPGFGASSRARLHYSPAFYHACLAFLADRLLPVDGECSILAAGHAAGYALACAADRPWVKRLVLLAPTWQGPLKVMGMRPAFRTAIRSLIRAPGIGQILYHLNTHHRVIGAMMRRHVYDEPITDARVSAKQSVARQPGARYASASFVTGGLDPAGTRAAFQTMLDRFGGRALIVCGDATPPRSRSDMQAIEPTPSRMVLWSKGALAMHEEHAATLSPHITAFLG
ncbi:alpha/beta fold hydrolase [Granulibacter bethesdensis]|uniref:Hydrolase n=1 Tax=Granulibacter bethesdensis (strain ATCC BAA-1260 / CGDNIH1) TaxID=391165 RepID=Q0BSU3_GRABC|nr:alpha/beta fold hydrolase [Granulibacter bethesdensis]ABI62109.1 Putative hydrolase [Granulibacter bethesdensis CGDNIH1]AHJ68990.1 Putative hydrolase [Granulibacter bethesdensis]APH51935.1 Putative hydrolase [Granulibacter bethesdensis]APH64625.1 Putative hydrolase [Granulibacter bethesdensis]